MTVWAVLFCILVLAAVYAWLLRHYALKGLEYRRVFAHPVYTEGQEAELVEVVRNDRPMMIPWLRVESRISPNLHFGRQDNLDVKGEMYHRSVFLLMPYQQITRRHKVRLTRRGAYDIGNATLTAGDLTGISQISQEVNLHAPVLVWPRLLDDSELPPPLNRLLGEYTVSRSLLSDPFLVCGIRPYRPGDNVRDIHWAASARTMETQLRLHDFTAQNRLMVLINSQTKENQWDKLMDYETGIIEKEISMAATLCTRTIRNGQPAGFGSNMPLDDSSESVVLLPEGGSSREEELLSAMARLSIKRTLTFPDFLRTMEGFTGMDYLVLTPYDAESIRIRLRELIRRGNTAAMYIMETGEVVTL